MNTIETGNPLQQLAQQLVQKFDTDSDGRLTTQEFTTFLTTFMGTLGTGANAAYASPSLAAATGGGSPLEGYDMRKMGDPSTTTVKYMFGRLAQNWNLASVNDMTSAEAFLTSKTGEMQAAGITVLEVAKDKIKVLDDAGQPAWIDVIRGAGAPNPAWQWMDTRF